MPRQRDCGSGGSTADAYREMPSDNSLREHSSLQCLQVPRCVGGGGGWLAGPELRRSLKGLVIRYGSRCGLLDPWSWNCRLQTPSNCANTHMLLMVMSSRSCACSPGALWAVGCGPWAVWAVGTGARGHGGTGLQVARWRGGGLLYVRDPIHLRPGDGAIPPLGQTDPRLHSLQAFTAGWQRVLYIDKQYFYYADMNPHMLVTFPHMLNCGRAPALDRLADNYSGPVMITGQRARRHRIRFAS